MKKEPIFKYEYWQKRPKKAFYWMCAIIVVSIGLSILMNANRMSKYDKQEGMGKELKKGVAIIKDDFSSGNAKMEQYVKCKKLESEIDSFLLKNSLTHRDSLRLQEIFQELEKIYKDN